MSENKLAEIKDDRDYAIRKGRVMERFRQEFHTRHKNNHLYRDVWEALLRDADPYELIEKLIEINADQFTKFQEMIPFVSPNYYLHKKDNPPIAPIEISEEHKKQFDHLHKLAEDAKDYFSKQAGISEDQQGKPKPR